MTSHCSCCPQLHEARISWDLLPDHLISHFLLLSQCEHGVVDSRGQFFLSVVLILVDDTDLFVYLSGPLSGSVAIHDFVQYVLPSMPPSAVAAQRVPLGASLVSQAVHHLATDFLKLITVGSVPFGNHVLFYPAVVVTITQARTTSTVLYRQDTTGLTTFLKPPPSCVITHVRISIFDVDLVGQHQGRRRHRRRRARVSGSRHTFRLPSMHTNCCSYRCCGHDVAR